MKRAGFLLRTVAGLIDTLLCIVALLIGGVTTTALWTYGVLSDRGTELLLDVLLPIVVLAYSSTEAFFAATPGKLLLRMRITRADGSPAPLSLRLLRWTTKWMPWAFLLVFVLTDNGLAYAIAGFTQLVVAVGLLAILNEDRQAWHDEWSHTAVHRLAPAKALSGPAFSVTPSAVSEDSHR